MSFNVNFEILTFIMTSLLRILLASWEIFVETAPNFIFG